MTNILIRMTVVLSLSLLFLLMGACQKRPKVGSASSSTAFKLTSVDYQSIHQLRAELCITSKDLARMKCNPEQVQSILSDTKEWYIGNKKGLLKAEDALEREISESRESVKRGEVVANSAFLQLESQKERWVYTNAESLKDPLLELKKQLSSHFDPVGIEQWEMLKECRQMGFANQILDNYILRDAVEKQEQKVAQRPEFWIAFRARSKLELYAKLRKHFGNRIPHEIQPYLEEALDVEQDIFPGFPQHLR